MRFSDNQPFIPIATERLTLRPLEEKDAEALARLANDKRVAQTLARLPFPYTLQDAHHFINYAKKATREKKHINLAIIHRAEQTLLGVIGLEEEVGYWLGHEYWGQGYGKEAMKALVHFAFLTLQKDYLSASVLQDNTASWRIFEGLGFKRIRSKECTSVCYKGTKPGFFYALSREEFLKEYMAIKRPITWVVAVILLNEKGQILLTERPMGKKMAGIWELPGGKIEAGETPEQALIRELKEELDIEVKQENLEPFTFVSYPYESFHLVMPFYICRIWEGTPRGAEGQSLAWAKYGDLNQFPVPPADIFLCHQLGDLLGKADSRLEGD
jgi:8-oxo-dGTP diphosphatase